MPKPLSLKALFELLPASPPDIKEHFLFVLGTDTVFTEKPTPPETCYERGETLSYLAQATVELLGETAEKKPADVLSYFSPSVDVINGPTTLGSEVGERIVQGLFLALRAAAAGKTSLQIAAHSRGAVETILILHELDRIKKELAASPHKSLKDILLSSPCALTVAAVRKFFPETTAIAEDTPSNRAGLLTKLQSLKINPFLIDPVPGDTIYGIPYIGWHDDRFYDSLPCTDNELLICRDERSSCFYPIIPKGTEPIIIPGHHGTACGNRHSQQGSKIPPTIDPRDTTSVQDLVVLKFFDFIYRTTGLFKTTSTPLTTAGHPLLNTLLNEYLLANLQEKKKLILKLYAAIYTNDNAYRYFTSTSYAYLGLAAAPDTHRWVHMASSTCTSLSTIISTVQGPFVNLEHARLTLSEYINIAELEHKDPPEQIETITGALGTMITAIKSASDSPLLKALTASAKTRDTLFNILSTLVDSVSRKYLNNQLDLSVKARLLEVIATILTLLKNAVDDKDLSAHRALFERCYDVVQQGIKLTIESHFSSLLQQYEKLHQQINLFLAPPTVFQSAFAEFLELLKDDDDLRGIHTHLSSLTSPSISGVQAILLEEMKKIEEDGTMDLDKKEKIVAKLRQHSTPLRKFAEAYELSIEEYLIKISKLHNALQELYTIYPQLASWLTTKTLSIKLSSLFAYRSSIEELAGLMLKEKRYDLASLPSTEAFYTAVKARALSLGAPDLMVATLSKTIAEQLESIAALNKTIAEQRESLAEKDESITTKDEALTSAEELQRKLCTKQQINCAFLIQNKLIPLTQRYLQHLFLEASKYVSIDTRDLKQALPLKSADAKNQAAYEKIRVKIARVQQIHTTLSDEKVPLAIERIENFTRALNDCAKALQHHREPAWVSYCKSAVAIIAIIVTGIVPGLIAIAYSHTQGRTPLFFNPSAGKRYLEEASFTVEKARRYGVSD
jgi:uncharacterized coiled-coil protein SlyX